MSGSRFTNDNYSHRDSRFDAQDYMTDRGLQYEGMTPSPLASNMTTGSRISHTGKGPKGWKRSDERIREDICECLENDRHLDASEIDVAVSEGIVTLTGKVEDRPSKRHAEDLIEYRAGVKDVRNELSVDQSFFEQARDFLTGKNEIEKSKASKSNSSTKTVPH